MRKNILYGDLILQDGKSKIQKNDYGNFNINMWYLHWWIYNVVGMVGFN
jgi:hypothetical protein